MQSVTSLTIFVNMLNQVRAERDEEIVGTSQPLSAMMSRAEKLSLAQNQIRQYEQKYNTTLSALPDGLPNDADFEMHEDFIEWEFWVDEFQRVKSDQERQE